MRYINFSDFARIIQQAGDAILSTDADFKIISWNAAAESLYGYNKEEAIGKKLGTLLKCRLDERQVNKELIDCRKNGFYEGEYVFCNRNGEALSIHASVTVLKQIDNDISGYLALHRKVVE